MTRPDRHLEVVSRTDATTVKRHLDQKEASLVRAVLDAEGYSELDVSCRALLAYWEPSFQLAPVKVAATRAGGDHGGA